MMGFLHHFMAAVDYEFEETILLKEHRFIVKKKLKKRRGTNWLKPNILIKTQK